MTARNISEISVLLANERNPGTTNQYGVGVPECNATVVAGTNTGSGQVTTEPALLFGYYASDNGVGTLNFRDGLAAGTIILTTPVVARGDNVSFPGVKFNDGINLEHNGDETGNDITVFWRPQ